MFESGGWVVADAAVAACAAMPAGEDMLAALAVIDPARVSADARISMLELYERCEAAISARRQRVLAAIDYTDTCGDGGQWAREEVAAALRLSCSTADSRLTVAHQLAERLQATLRALAAGDITYLHARVLCDAVDHLDTEQARAVQQRVLRRAGEQTLGEFRAAVARAVLAADPATAQERQEQAREQRSAWLSPQPDGMATLGGYLPADHAAAAWTAIDDLAHRELPGDPRTIEQRRADALVDLLTATRHDDTGDRDHPQRSPAVHVEVTIPFDTLLGIRDLPAELAGYGPITAAQARWLAMSAGADWRRLVYHPDNGRLISLDPKPLRGGDWRGLLLAEVPPAPPAGDGYRPSAELARFVRARDRRCAFPGCRRRAIRCELDHTTSYPHGPTSPANLRPLCKRHHQAKTLRIWTLVNNPDGTWTWTSPLGRTYTRHPHDYRRGP